MKKIQILLLTIITILLPLRGGFADENLKVAVMTHLTGDFSAWGQAYIEGIMLGQERINSSGGIQGKRVTLVIEDTRFDSALTASASQKLLNIDHVQIAMVSTFTEALVAGPLFEKAKVPLLVFGDSGGKIETIGKFVFSTGTWVDGYALSASKFLVEQKNMKKVAIIATNNAWSQSTADEFGKDFEQHGGSIVYRADQNPTDTDFRTILERVRAAKADAVFAPITAGVIPFFEQARRINLQIPLILAGGALDSDVIAAAPAAVEGRYVTNAFLDKSRPQAAEFLSHYQQKYGREPMYPSVSARGFDGFKAVATALRNAKGLSGEDIQRALLTVDFQGAGFHLKLDQSRTAKLPVKVLQVKDGHLVVVGDAYRVIKNPSKR